MSIDPDAKGPVALVFPGQGAQNQGMLAPFVHLAAFAPRYEAICDLCGLDPMRVAHKTPEVLNRNLVSSLLTVMASLCALDLMPPSAQGGIAGYAGYSVGQWTALYAAGVIDENCLLNVVAKRAGVMDAALAAAGPTGMLAVIGIPRDRVEALCAEARANGDLIAISNDNAPLQLTLAGSVAALDRMAARLVAERAKRVVPVPVAGAWHSAFMERAVVPLAAVLAQIDMSLPRAPVIDNVTGRPFAPLLRTTDLSAQVARPVLWRQSVGALQALGACHFIEVGYGDVLTRFGFFIDRSVTHEALAPPPRTPRRDMAQA
jgi:[acyl-carrier-protein] S-malonyltransferase